PCTARRAGRPGRRAATRRATRWTWAPREQDAAGRVELERLAADRPDERDVGEARLLGQAHQLVRLVRAHRGVADDAARFDLPSLVHQPAREVQPGVAGEREAGAVRDLVRAKGPEDL